MTKCAKCDTGITTVRVDNIKAVSKGGTFEAVAYCCPSCGAAISVELDPFRLQADTLSKIQRLIDRR